MQLGLFVKRRGFSGHQLRILQHLFYAAGYCRKAGLDPELAAEAAFSHYLEHGLQRDVAPGPFFDVERCRLLMDARDGTVVFTWLTRGMRDGVVPTALFDRAEYLELYPDVAAAGADPFLHYLQHGRFENRTPSKKLANLVLSLATYKGNRHDLLWRIAEQLGRLESQEMQALISHAASIEPMIMRPQTIGAISWPPIVHMWQPVAEAGRRIRSTVRRTHYDHVVLVPHCRTAGSARVAGHLIQHLRSLYPSDSLLLVLTDGSFFEHPEWFGTGYDRLDLHAIVAAMDPPYRLRALVDLIRGLRPKSVFNVNSRLMWDATTTFGSQLAMETQIFAYLFTWDLDEAGNKGGYPIEYFELGFDKLTRVLVDNAALKDELTQRYVMSRGLQDKLRVLYSPAPETPFDFSGNFAARRAAGYSLRGFWSGRFDRQKRFDLVMDITRRRPEIEISAWGKSVLGHSSLDISNPPGNLKLMGTYREFDSLPINSFDFFLYTSQWDGMPTVLVDCGSRGIPVIASRVGGVGEIIDETTGWPVDDVLNPDAYIQAIEAMTSDPDEVTRRASVLRERVRTMFSSRQYSESLAAAISESKPE
jgi:glycosyltransferase involved in cell wall biosynthesis